MNFRELTYYIMVGLVATAVDWSTFAISVKWLNIHYQAALLFALFLGSLVHYFSNKFFTFKCHSQQYSSQVPLYIFLVVFTVSCSMGMMSLLVKWTVLTKMDARILTTGLMLIPNYLLHKYLTFSKRIFLQPKL